MAALAEQPLVAVIGLGGVGSHCAHALLRAGVRRFRLVDFDRVSLSSLNRHAVATRRDVGTAKVVACAQHFHAIAPDCSVEAHDEMFTAASADTLLGPRDAVAQSQSAAGDIAVALPFVVVDCIDDVPTKADLLEACLVRGLRVISALGSGAKGDPVRLCALRGLRDVENDALGSKLRQVLKGRGVDVSTVPFVYSSQKAARSLLPLTNEQRQAPAEFGNVANFRLRVIPVLGTQPAVAGIAIAAQTMLELCNGEAQRPFRMRPAPAPKRQLVERFLEQLRRREEKISGGRGLSVDVTAGEVSFLLHEVWCNRSALNTDLSLSGASGDKFTLARWDPAKPVGACNLILCSEAEADAHEGPRAVPEFVRERIMEALAWVEQQLALPSQPDSRSKKAAAASGTPLQHVLGCEAATVECTSRDLPVGRLPEPSQSEEQQEEERALMEEQLSRSAAFFGEQGHAKVQDAFVVVVGCGALGSMAAALLLRAGVRRLRLLDDANVGPELCHAVASRTDIGEPKVKVCQKALALVRPHCQLGVAVARVTASNASFLLCANGDANHLPDVVVDCTGNASSRAELLHACAGQLGIRTVTAIASPGMADPTRLAISPLSDVHNCPAAVALRLGLISAGGAGAASKSSAAGSAAIDAVYSTELLHWRTAAPALRGAYERMTRLSMGVAAAAAALHAIAGEELPPAPPPGAMGAWKRLAKGLPLDAPAAGCVLESIWLGRSALGRDAAAARMRLVRWDRSRGFDLANIVPMTEDEASAHDESTEVTGSLPEPLCGALLRGAGRASAASVPADAAGDSSNSALPALLLERQRRAHEVLATLRLHLEGQSRPEAGKASALMAMECDPGANAGQPVDITERPAGSRQLAVRASGAGRPVATTRFVVAATAAVATAAALVASRWRLTPCWRLSFASAWASLLAAATGWRTGAACRSVRDAGEAAPVGPLKASPGGLAPSIAREVGTGFSGLVGSTPLVELRSLSEATGCRIVAKAEFLSPGGCQKDRVARQILDDAEASGLLRPGGTVVEGTSGSTGISLALAGAARGYRVVVVMPDDQAAEKVQQLRRFGAEVELVRPASISSPQHYVNVARRRALELNSAPGTGPGAAFFADQFENPSNFRAHYTGTGPELWAQCSGELDAFVMSAGTGGTLAGVGCYLKGIRPQTEVVLADVQGSSLYFKVAHGVLYASEQAERTVRRHRTDTIAEGIGLDRLTANFAKGLREHNGDFPGIDCAVRVTDQEALEMAHYLLAHEGLFVGSSAAVNCAAACKVARKLSAQRENGGAHVPTVATVLCDSGTRHVTKFYSAEAWEAYGLVQPVERRPRGDLSFIA